MRLNTRKAVAVVESTREINGKTEKEKVGSRTGAPGGPSWTDEVCRHSINSSRTLPGPAPNDAETVQAIAADKARNYPEALRLFLKIDADGEAPITHLPPTLLWMDVVISKHVGNVAFAREKIGHYYEVDWASRRTMQRPLVGLKNLLTPSL
jgi:hypothetical protein